MIMRGVRGGSLRLCIMIKEYRFAVMSLREVRCKGIFWDMMTYTQLLSRFQVAKYY